MPRRSIHFRRRKIRTTRAAIVQKRATSAPLFSRYFIQNALKHTIGGWSGNCACAQSDGVEVPRANGCSHFTPISVSRLFGIHPERPPARVERRRDGLSLAQRHEVGGVAGREARGIERRVARTGGVGQGEDVIALVGEIRQQASPHRSVVAFEDDRRLCLPQEASAGRRAMGP